MVHESSLLKDKIVIPKKNTDNKKNNCLARSSFLIIKYEFLSEKCFFLRQKIIAIIAIITIGENKKSNNKYIN